MKWIHGTEKPQHYVDKCCRLIGENFFFTAYYDWSKQVFVPRNFNGTGGYVEPKEIEYLENESTPSESYWRKRCEAAEAVNHFMKFNSTEGSYDWADSNFERYKEAMNQWQALKSNPPEENKEQEEWINVHDNSDGFRAFLDSKGIKYKRNEHWTMVKKEVDLYWLGRHCEEWKQASITPKVL